MEKRLTFTSCFIPVIWFGRMGDKSVFLAFPQLEILARGHSLEVADASALKHAVGGVDGATCADRRAGDGSVQLCDVCTPAPGGVVAARKEWWKRKTARTGTASRGDGH